MKLLSSLGITSDKKEEAAPVTNAVSEEGAATAATAPAAQDDTVVSAATSSDGPVKNESAAPAENVNVNDVSPPSVATAETESPASSAAAADASPVKQDECRNETAKPAEAEAEASPAVSSSDATEGEGKNVASDVGDCEKSKTDKSSRASSKKPRDVAGAGSEGKKSTQAATVKDDAQKRAVRETKSSSDKKRDGEVRLATQQITSVLEKTRTMEELVAEDRKLRNDLSNMRRRLNGSQDFLNMTQATVNKFIERQDMPADFRSAWQATEAKVTAGQEELEKELAAAGGGEQGTDTVSNKRSRQGRTQRRQPWKRSTRTKGSENQEDGEVSPPSKQGKPRAGAVASAGEYGGQHQQMPNVPGGPRQHQQMQVGAQTRRRGRGNRRQQPRDGTVPAPLPETAQQIAQAESIRDELRAASTTADLESAIAKAKGFGMKYEVKIGSKKLDKLKGPSPVTADAPTTAAPVSTPPASTVDASAAAAPTSSAEA